jgi:5-methylthioadenosine/S-adenosylhomocysteine deaminase
MSLLIRDARILTQDEERRRLRGNVYVEDGLIVSVGKDAPEAETVIDAAGGVLIPGLVNAHTHAAMGLFRGYGDDLPLTAWLETRIWPAEDRMDEEAVRVGTRLGLLEMIAGGTTAYQDMYMNAQAMAEEADAAGIRAVIGWGLADVGRTPKGLAHPAMGAVETFLGAWRLHERVHGAPAPHATYTCHDETLAECAQLAERYDTRFHTHAHETRDEVYESEASRGKRPLAVLDGAGALTERTVLAHCGWVTKAEVGRIAEAGAAVVHCPVSNMKLATGGTTPVPELLEAGAAVALGTDGPASNNTLDMFETMKLTALLHKHARWDPEVADAQTVLDMATRGGAAALGMADALGSIEQGKRADLVLLDHRRPHWTPLHDPVSQIVYAARPTDVATTVVDGRVLYRDGRFETLDATKVMADARRVARDLVGGGEEL